MSQSPTPKSPITLPDNFAMKLNPQPGEGTMFLSQAKRKQMLDRGQLYKDPLLPLGYNIVDGRGGRRSQKRPTARRLRSSKARNARKARATRRK